MSTNLSNVFDRFYSNKDSHNQIQFRRPISCERMINSGLSDGLFEMNNNAVQETWDRFKIERQVATFISKSVSLAINKTNFAVIAKDHDHTSTAARYFYHTLGRKKTVGSQLQKFTTYPLIVILWNLYIRQIWTIFYVPLFLNFQKSLIS